MMALHADHDLLQSYLDGMLDAVEAAALESRFVNDPELANALLFLTREEAILREWSATTRAAAQVSPADVAASTSTGQPSVAAAPRRRFARISGFATVAASLAALVIYFMQPDRPAGGPAIATFEDIQGEVMVVGRDGRSEAARTGQSDLRRAGSADGRGRQFHGGADSRLPPGARFETRIRLRNWFRIRR